MYAYCLFCQTQRCKRIAQLMEIRGINRAFSPQILRKERKQGENRDRSFDLLPGYVFLYNEEQLTDFSVFFGIDGVIRKVGRAEDWYVLQGPDQEFAMNLLEKDGVVGALTLVKVGERVELEDPLFRHSNGVVTRIDYRKERARVDFKFEGIETYTWISVAGIKKTDSD